MKTDQKGLIRKIIREDFFYLVTISFNVELPDRFTT
jgi:hypothetical protein